MNLAPRNRQLRIRHRRMNLAPRNRQLRIRLRRMNLAAAQPPSAYPASPDEPRGRATAKCVSGFAG
jgi:hypothetical protein